MDFTLLGIGASLCGTIATAASGVVWAVRQEGRINAHDQLFVTREKVADERHEDLKERLERIERKLDKANGKG